MELPQTQMPETDYFITADAGYCHILPARIVLSTHITIGELPPSVDKRNIGALLLGGLGVAFGTFLMVNFFIVGFTMMGVLFLIGMIYATKVLADVARYSTIRNIERESVEAVKVFKPKIGYLFVIIQFKNKEGRSSRLKVKLYDSLQNELHALKLLKKEGLIA